jgi:hypothetical protein
MKSLLFSKILYVEVLLHVVFCGYQIFYVLMNPRNADHVCLFACLNYRTTGHILIKFSVTSDHWRLLQTHTF